MDIVTTKASPQERIAAPAGAEHKIIPLHGGLTIAESPFGKKFSIAAQALAEMKIIYPIDLAKAFAKHYKLEQSTSEICAKELVRMERENYAFNDLMGRRLLNLIEKAGKMTDAIRSLAAPDKISVPHVAKEESDDKFWNSKLLSEYRWMVPIFKEKNVASYKHIAAIFRQCEPHLHKATAMRLAHDYVEMLGLKAGYPFKNPAGKILRAVFVAWKVAPELLNEMTQVPDTKIESNTRPLAQASRHKPLLRKEI